MISLLKFLGGPWEDVRGGLESDLEHIQEAINSNWNNNFGSTNTLQPGTILGDPAPATRYVANTGPNNVPQWDQVALANGVKGRLPFHNLPTLDHSTLLGRRNGGGGDVEEIALGTNLTMTGGGVLNAAGSGISSPGTTVDSEIVLFSGSSGSAIKRATGSGIVWTSSGVYQTPVSIPSDATKFLNGSATPAFSKPTTKVTGTTTNDDAIAGDLGELISAQLVSGSATSLTTTSPKNVTSMSLTAGDWDVTGVIDYILSGTTGTGYKSGSSSSTGAFGGQDSFVNLPLQTTTLSDTLGHIIPTFRYSLASTTTIYLVAQATFTVGTVTAYGTIRARRVR